MTFINQLIAGFMATIMSLFGFAAPLDNNGVHSHAAAAHVENATTGDNAPSAQPGEELSPQKAVERELFLATEELGHEFMTIRFEGTTTSHIIFLESYNPDTDQAAVDRMMKSLADNGFVRVDAVA
ncbi:hypothetical protein [Corynebacterium minutissimum]|uniref:Secreted protein n=1 Tax=Corynebacterium minutissimum TaxID=38301 RepID=A0A2X4RFW5_9CORY|nr:hypothetical protein [Corynebacterium minutissimum]QPS60356.1 hypothetical protein I6G51_03935 [Corynebacterium minutissimum]QQA78855.1 hypothetical protein I6H49_08920 [Corynebacterium minutissimum]SQI00799.1 Uncharacterised protein [Corynebacterium minutissimum]VEG05133.1 Uncharacterised protein [Corynebacterium minutissimum]